MTITPEYQAYLYSDEWRINKRLKVLNRAKFRCERCKKQQATQVHHLTYERIFKEKLSDLQAVCADCHMEIHGIKKPKTVRIYSIRTPKRVSVFGKVLARMIR